MSSVSVVMAVYNGQRFLRQQVESVLAQLQPGDELIVVDDGSTDGSLAFLNGVDSPAVRILANPRNLGVAGTFERGLRLATHEYIFLCDQDDVCLLYLFAGLAKLKGVTWWNGFAMWGTVANLEYQTVDLTWLANWPLLINLLTQVTVLWEVSYCVLIWNRHSRPLMQALAVPVHLGIALCFGMLTFGLAMLAANVAFVRPDLIRRVLRVLTHEPPRSQLRPPLTRLHQPDDELASVA